MINILSCSSQTSTSSFLLSFAAPILVIVGWYVVHAATEARERRKQQVDYALKIIEKVNQIERCAIEYHCAEIREIQKEPRITCDLKELSHDVIFVGCITDATTESIKKLRKAITLKNFASSGFVKQEYEEEIARGIYEAAVDLRKSLKDAITKVYFEKKSILNSSK